MYNSSLKLSISCILAGLLLRNDLLQKGFPTGVLPPQETWYFILFSTTSQNIEIGVGRYGGMVLFWPQTKVFIFQNPEVLAFV